MKFIFAFLLATLIPAAHAQFQLEKSHGQVVISQQARGFWKDLWQAIRGPHVAGDLVITVKDSTSGSPISGAQVMVGDSRNNPFEGNVATTDSSGSVAFSHPSLREGKAVTVTASKDGYAHLSVMQVQGNQMDLGLVAKAPASWAFLEGATNGWPTGLDRKTLEVGFFLPGVRPEMLLNFDPYQIVSSYKVEIDVYGRRLVPGNVVMPPQDKTYMIFPVHIEKPNYIMPVPAGFEAHLAAIAGNVPMGKALDMMKEKDFLGILNITNLTHVTWTPRTRVNGNMKTDLTLSIPLRQKAAQVSVSNVPQGLDVVAISMADPANDRGDFAPLDVKSIKSETMKGGRGAVALALPAQARSDDSHFVFAALFDRSQFIRDKAGNSTGDQRSVVGSIRKLQRNGQSESVDFQKFLKAIQPGAVSGDFRSYAFTSPNAPEAGLNASFLLLNVYAEVPNATTQGKTKTVIWNAVLSPSATGVKLPDLGQAVLPGNSPEGTEYFFEVVAVRSSDAARLNQEFNLQQNLNELEHVSTMAKKIR